MKTAWTVAAIVCFVSSIATIIAGEQGDILVLLGCNALILSKLEAMGGDAS